MTEWRYSQLIFIEKTTCMNDAQAMLLKSERMSEMHFPAIQIPEFQRFFLWCPSWGYLTETVNDCRQKCVHKSLFARCCSESKKLKNIIIYLLKSVNERSELRSHQTYSKMLRQFRKPNFNFIKIIKNSSFNQSFVQAYMA